MRQNCQIREGGGQDAFRDAARTKIQKLEKALEVMGDVVGPAVDALKAELDKARQAAKVPPLWIQIALTQDFIERLEKCWIWSKRGKRKLCCWRTG